MSLLLGEMVKEQMEPSAGAAAPPATEQATVPAGGSAVTVTVGAPIVGVSA